jgi:uncharacterized protein (TIGR01777 family)
MSKRVVIYGASGFVGSGLASMLAADGWEVIGVSRKGTGQIDGVSTWSTTEKIDLSGCEAVINLAGDPVDQRWTDTRKQSFHSSRVGVTDQIVQKISAIAPEIRPKVLLNASAVGYYGGRGDELLDEKSERGEGYLADLCDLWEKSAVQAEALGVRVVRFRIGVVLGKDGRAFQKLLLVFKAGVGGQLGNGKQWMPWIHVEDLRRSIVFCLSQPEIHGAVNATAPQPETNASLTKKLAKAVGRWVFFPVPGIALKILLGGFGGALLQGQHAVPKRLLDAGFQFHFDKLEDALKDLV